MTIGKKIFKCFSPAFENSSPEVSLLKPMLAYSVSPQRFRLRPKSLPPTGI